MDIQVDDPIATSTLLPYDLSKNFEIECHNTLGGGDDNEEKFMKSPSEMLNADEGEGKKWYTNARYHPSIDTELPPDQQKPEESDVLGWIHIKFPKPLVINGWGLKVPEPEQYE